MQSSRTYFEQINKARTAIQTAEAIIIGAGAGLSTAAGFTYSGERFYKYFADFHEKYGIADMYSGGFYPFKTLEEYWAWWSRHICCNRYGVVGGNTPAIIKYPFWKMTLNNPDSVYICVNLGEAACPREIEGRSVCIDEDLSKILSDLTR